MAVRDATHDPALRSWVATAQASGTDFPIQNLPLAVFATTGAGPRCGVAIGDQVLDLRAAHAAGLVSNAAAAADSLAPLMAAGRGASAALRAEVSALLRADAPARPDLLVPMAQARMHLPCSVRNFSDFMASYDHCARLGARRDPNNPLPPPSATCRWRIIPVPRRCASRARTWSARMASGSARTAPCISAPPRRWTTNWKWPSGSPETMRSANP